MTPLASHTLNHCRDAKATFSVAHSQRELDSGGMLRQGDSLAVYLTATWVHDLVRIFLELRAVWYLSFLPLHLSACLCLFVFSLFLRSNLCYNTTLSFSNSLPSFHTGNSSWLHHNSLCILFHYDLGSPGPRNTFYKDILGCDSPVHQGKPQVKGLPLLVR